MGDGGVEDERAAASCPERYEVLASAIAGMLAGALKEHDQRAAIIAPIHDGDAAAIDHLNGATSQNVLGLFGIETYLLFLATVQVAIFPIW